MTVRQLPPVSRWPALRPPRRPPSVRPLQVREAATPRSLTLHVAGLPRRFTIPAAVLAICHQIGEALVPIVMGYGIDKAVRTGDLDQMLVTLVLLAGTFAGLSFSFRLGSFLGEIGQQAVRYRLRMQVVRALLDPRAGRASRYLPGEALSLATSDVQNLAMAPLLGVYPAGQLAAVVFGGAVLLAISWPVGLVVLVGTPLILFAMDRAGGVLVRRTESEQQLAADASAHATDIVTGYRVVKGVRAEAEAAERYRHQSRRALAGTLRARTAAGRYRGITEGSTALIVALVALVSGLLAVRGHLTIGQLITVVGLAQLLISPISAFAADAGSVWASCRASARRLLPLLRPAPHDDASRPMPAAGADGAPALRVRVPGLPSIEVGDGELVALDAAADVAGALVEVLSLRKPPGPGEVELYGVSLHDVDPDTARELLLVAPHAADLFEGTVLENIALERVSPERARHALVLAAGGDMLEGLPEGEHTPVGEAGLQLSGGQRQRVALARALAADAAVTVLHEPTSSIDSVTEAAVADGIRVARSGRATLVVTSSPALLAAADRVLT